MSLATWADVVPAMRGGLHVAMLARVATLRLTSVIYPAQERVLRALELTDFNAVRVVILGQDPYHGPNQADGLAFSVPEGIQAPPSLVNIFKEIQRDVYGGEERAFSTDLSRWAQQGVLLLNAVLTVEAGKAASHQGLGWEPLTDDIVATIAQKREHVVFMLWGRFAQSKRRLIDGRKHLILEAAHPSPLSASQGFMGCGHFSKANAYLVQHGYAPIVW